MAFAVGSTLLLTSLCFLACGGPHRAIAQDQEQCQSIVSAASSTPGCSPLGNCTGLTCVLDDASIASFFVNKCTDPLQIDVSFENATGVYFSNTFASDGEITQGQVTVSLTATRDRLNDVVNVQILADSQLVFPPTNVPLNQSVCMCETLKTAAQLNVENTITSNCMVNPNCTGIECEFRIFTDYFIEVDWQRCDFPTGVLIALRLYNEMILTENYFNGSVNTVVSPNGIPLYVTMENTDYSTSLLQVTIEVLDQMVTLINVSDVIVDKSGCVPPEVELPIGIPADPVSIETCSALTILAGGDHEAQITTCNVTKTCSGLACSTANVFRTDMQFLSCTQRIFVEVRRLGILVLAETVGQTKSVSLGFGTASIIIRNVSSTIMGVEVDLFTGFNPGNPINLLPYVQIRRSDYCLCPENDCPSVAGLPTIVPSYSTPMPIVTARALFAIVVPIIFILLIVIVVLVVLVACLAWRKRSKKDGSSVPFQNMTGKLGSDDGDPAETSSREDTREPEELGEKKEAVM